MAKAKKRNQSKAAVKVHDLSPKKNAKGGTTQRKAGGGQQEYIVMTLDKVIVSG